MASNRAVIAVLAVFGLVLAGCGGTEAEHVGRVTTGGNAARGAQMIQYYGCGSCHIIPGISGASGLAGAPLSGIANRIYIAGVLQNTPENMVRWIKNPKAVDQKTAMPYLGITQRDAIDIAAYLYTLQ